MNKLFFSFIAFIVVCTGCSKSSDEPGTTVSGDYFVTTSGSWWMYKNTSAAGGADYKITMTSKDTVPVAGGITYKVLMNSLTGGSQYQAKSGNNYYRFAAIPAISANGTEELYLKSDQAVNATWQASYPVALGTQNGTATLVYTIAEKGITKTIQGKSYSNVTHVSLAINGSVNVGPPLGTVGIGTVGTGDFYYAAGIGMISSKLNVNLSSFGAPNVDESSELLTYEIK